ncbi:MAG TPA: DUF2334 domain-containing protein [Verrucomicrobiae bacterium]|nr:DUF2334 domain-containing protein [Verrucomicrobiae bacterium]
MRYVIIRDDDTCALTPIECLETLYRPFLERNLPVNLATIPNVRSDVFYPKGPLKGQPEGFLAAAKDVKPGAYSIGSNGKLVRYLQENPGYKIVHHAYHHEFVGGVPEFDIHDRSDIARRLDLGADYLREAGFPQPQSFVAPYDRITRESYLELAARFKVISTGWFNWSRTPIPWWPQLLASKIRRQKHWRVNDVTLLSHPGCLLSYHRPYDTMLEEIKRSISSQTLTVLVTHWWEFYRTGEPDSAFIQVLHDTARYLASSPDIHVISFDSLAGREIPA